MKNILFIILFSFSLYGDEINDKNFRELIVSYNHGFLLANKKNKFEHLQKYLTQQLYYKTRVWIESYHDNYLFMDAHLLSMKFEAFEKDGVSATLDTKEIWNYKYIDMRSKKVVAQPTKIDYKIRYYFIQLEDGSWKINHIKTLSEHSTALKANK